MNAIEKFSIVRISEEGENDTEDVIARECSLTIILNNQELATILCSPTNLEYLAVGFLFSEGLLKSKDEIKKIVLDTERGVVRVATEEAGELAQGVSFREFITSGGGKGLQPCSAIAGTSRAKIKSQTQVSAPEVFALVNEFVQHSKVFKATGGVHSAALCHTKGILVFSEDIGRHNAIDKVFGECILRDIPMDDHMIITSGRISSEILLKVVKGNIPILISKSAPTNLGVRLADELGITLIGFVRGKKMNIYTNRWRVVAQRHE